MQSFIIYALGCGVITDWLLQGYGKQPVGWKRCVLIYMMAWLILPLGVLLGIFCVITGRRL